MREEEKEIDLWKIIKDKDFWTKVGILLFFAFFIYGLFLQPLISRLWGVNEIGHKFESPKPYTAKYYVNLFPEDNEVKNYKVEADLHVYKECEQDGEGTICWRMINLEKVYFPDKELSFDDCLIDDDKVSCFDENDEYWDIEFHNEKVEKKYN